MTEETPETGGNVVKKRRIGRGGKGSKSKKRMKVFQGKGEKVKMDAKMKKIIRQRVRDYNSDNDEDEDEDEEDEDEEAAGPIGIAAKENKSTGEDKLDGKISAEEEEELDVDEDKEVSEDEEWKIQPGVTRFTEGCNAFRIAFRKITKSNVSDSLLGPVLSANKKLVAEKLAEEESERKVKGESKKQKQMLAEKGHVMPANFLDAHEKILIGVATKGVVKLFNAVNKAQHAQKGLNPLRSKDAKVIRKQRKEAFFSELGKRSQLSDGTSTKGGQTNDGPGWAPLREGYMLTSGKLKDWDKMADTNVAVDTGKMMDSDDGSSDED